MTHVVSRLALLLVLGLSAQTGPVAAASPRFFFDPIEVQAQRCVALGQPWKARVQEAMRLAQTRTANILPSQSWAQILTSPSAPASAAPLRADAATCEKFVAYYSDPKLSERIRGRTIAGVILKQYTGCAAEFPDMSASLRSAWIAAFKRNGLDPLEQLFDEGVQTSWRKPSQDQQSREECKKALHFLDGKEFDQAASEQNTKRFLGIGS
jgi:hypothetical protein